MGHLKTHGLASLVQVKFPLLRHPMLCPAVVYHLINVDLMMIRWINGLLLWYGYMYTYIYIYIHMSCHVLYCIFDIQPHWNYRTLPSTLKLHTQKLQPSPPVTCSFCSAWSCTTTVAVVPPMAALTKLCLSMVRSKSWNDDHKANFQ